MDMVLTLTAAPELWSISSTVVPGRVERLMILWLLRLRAALGGFSVKKTAGLGNVKVPVSTSYANSINYSSRLVWVT